MDTITNDENSPDAVRIGDSNDIVSSLSRFYNNEEMSDILLKLGPQRFYAHKFVLVLMSDVFRTMCSKRWVQNAVNELELNENEQCIPVFPMFLHFLYHGTVYVNTATALPLLMLADKYNVQPLKENCEKYIQTQVKQGNIGGAIRWLPYLQLCGHKELERDCIDVIIREMETVLDQNDLLHLNLNLLTLLLGRNDIVVLCEYRLYEGVVKWVKSCDNIEDQKQYLRSLLPLIRFSMMFPEQLLAIEKSEFGQTHQNILAPYLALAHRYRSLATEVIDETFSSTIYQPRNYMQSTWCQFINLDADNLSFFSKPVKLSTATDILPDSTVPKEPNWQFQILNERQHDHRSHKLLSSTDAVPWRLCGPNNFTTVSPTSCSTIPLQISVRSMKAIRPGTAVDISLFMVKKDSIVKHLDTKTVLSHDPSLVNAADQMQAAPSKNGLAMTMNRERMFQPSPMHFAFEPVHSQNDILLRHRFSREDFEHPAEVPCVSFGPHFANPPRPYQSVRVAIITKPRVNSPTDQVGDERKAGEGVGTCVDSPEAIYEHPGSDDLPILG